MVAMSRTCSRLVAGMAIDVTPLEEARGELKRHVAAQARTLDQLTTAVANIRPR